MSGTKIKICGLTTMQDIEYVNEALPDYIGFVFAKSRRQLNPQTAVQLKSALNSSIKGVGVFVNESINMVSELCNSGVIDFVQLHGDEDNEYISTLRQKISNPIIKAIRVKDTDSLKNLPVKDVNPPNAVSQCSYDFLLLDAYSDKEFGGTGKTFNWEFAKNLDKCFFLAGGITLENAKAAIEFAKPYCLDVSSGVETNGIKDKNKIIQLVKLVRSVE